MSINRDDIIRLRDAFTDAALGLARQHHPAPSHEGIQDALLFTLAEMLAVATLRVEALEKQIVTYRREEPGT